MTPRVRQPDPDGQDGLFDLDDPAVLDHSPEAWLLARVAARQPADAVLWPDGGQRHPRVLLTVVAHGTYGRVTGLDRDRKPVTVQGYVLRSGTQRGGFRGWPDTIVHVTLGDQPHLQPWPDGPTVTTVETDLDGRLTILPTQPGMPPGEGPPWLRMPVEEQILTARTALGLRIRIVKGPHNELWRVEGCPEQLTGEVAWWLFGGNYGTWEGRSRPVYAPWQIHAALRDGRLPTPTGRRPDANAAPQRPGRGGATDRTAPTEGPRERGEQARQRRQATRWLAEGLAYRGVADAFYHSDSHDVHTPDGQPVDVAAVGAHLVHTARTAHDSGQPQPAGDWRGVAIAFHPVDEQTIEVWLTGDGTNPVRLPLPVASIRDHDSRIHTRITDTILDAHTRADRLIGAAHDLADRITAPPTAPSSHPATPTGRGLDDITDAVSGARTAFAAPPRPATASTTPPPPDPTVHTRQTSPPPGRHR